MHVALLTFQKFIVKKIKKEKAGKEE